MDGQQIVALGIVAIAAAAVGRRMFGQIAAFWSDKKSAGCGGCDGCGPAKSTTATVEKKAPTPQLVQLQTRPPMRIKRSTESK